MKNINKWFKNLGFGSKITIICILVGLIPVILIGSFSYYQMRNLLITREKENLNTALTQAMDNMNYKMEVNLNSMNYLIWNTPFVNALNQDYKRNIDMFLAYRDAIDNQLLTVRNLNRDIVSFTVYTNGSLYPHGNNLRPFRDIESAEWLTALPRPLTTYAIVNYPEHTIRFAARLNDNGTGNTNILSMTTNYKKTFSKLSSLLKKEYGLIITDSNNKTIYTYDNYNETNYNYRLSPDKLLKSLQNDTLKTQYIYYSSHMESTDWTAYIYRPIRIVSAAARNLSVLVFIVIIISVTILLFISFKLSRITVQPLVKLSGYMKKVENGDLSVAMTYDRTDEIGELIKHFNIMILRLNQMIDEVYKSTISKQQYEMKALQAQINPHFFYNSLSLINGKAILSGQNDISQMAQLLSTFYRTTLNNGKNRITVKGEWDNTVSYIKIQQLMHPGSFEAVLDIEESILAFQMINLILQPLVENAIIHGISHKETPGSGTLTVTGKKIDAAIVFTVKDNGCGIPDEILQNITAKASKGYGVQNVQRRINLAYGDNYGITYISKIHVGTKVTLRIPVEL
ncbi:sensor histidine kinase [Anaerocolumna sp. MB42-C2]|uniref:sensor histidine kinase n=1 Tax=Anaerocolumna sp. MB42-C2 TaxID=3070997 RepID=UPI0027E085B6|nr:sensor histidine kinase [Anaerocolumna sp. MB42-C2]WMJ87155.1 sensor histidine kinase [Anaerocolumna sp. MB42-C2]